MENMERRVFSAQPEEVESEQDPLKEKVSTWIESYAAERASRPPTSYEIPAEVEEWFTAYDALEQDLDARKWDIKKENWIQEHNALEQEYQEKTRQPDYRLFELRKESAKNEDKKDQHEYEIERIERRLKAAQEEKRWEENADNIPPRNVLTNFEETATAMADIEGLGWANSQDKDEFSLLGTLRTLEKNKEHVREDQWMYEIYGSGGINRWLVYGDGRVKFSEHHGNDRWLSKEEFAKKIARRGFQIH